MVFHVSAALHLIKEAKLKNPNIRLLLSTPVVPLNDQMRKPQWSGNVTSLLKEWGLDGLNVRLDDNDNVGKNTLLMFKVSSLSNT